MDTLYFFALAFVTWAVSEIAALCLNGTNWVVLYPIGKVISVLVFLWGIFQNFFSVTISVK